MLQIQNTFVNSNRTNRSSERSLTTVCYIMYLRDAERQVVKQWHSSVKWYTMVPPREGSVLLTRTY